MNIFVNLRTMIIILTMRMVVVLMFVLFEEKIEFLQKKLRQNVNRFATYGRNVVHRPNNDLNSLINEDHLVE